MPTASSSSLQRQQQQQQETIVVDVDRKKDSDLYNNVAVKKKNNSGRRNNNSNDDTKKNKKDLKWIFHGTIVIPTENPFSGKAIDEYNKNKQSLLTESEATKIVEEIRRAGSTSAAEKSTTTTTTAGGTRTASSIRMLQNEKTKSRTTTWLGPGLKMLHDHILTVDMDGFIKSIEPAETWFANDDDKEDCADQQHVTAASTNDTNESITELINEASSTIQQEKEQECCTAEAPQYIRLRDDYEFLCPGFIDLHYHASQFTYTGTATDRPLMGDDGWLHKYAFPAESSLLAEVGISNDKDKDFNDNDNDEEDIGRTDDTAHVMNDTAMAVSQKQDQRTKMIFTDVIQCSLRNGTTTALYWGTLNVEPCITLVDVCFQYGQRSLIGKVCMDRNSPRYYQQTTKQNMQETKKLIQYIHDNVGREQQIQQQQQQSQVVTTMRASETTTVASSASLSSVSLPRQRLPLVLPVIMPRFIPTCTPQLMLALGQLANQYQPNIHITSHISESIDEVQWSQNLDKQDRRAGAKAEYGDGDGADDNDDVVDAQEDVVRTDTEIFQSYGLLSDRCIMAHGVHLDNEHGDWDILRKHGTAVCHCPLSNFYFANDILPTRRMLQHNNLIGLGTDVAGGYDPSMLVAQRMSVIASRATTRKNKHYSTSMEDAKERCPPQQEKQQQQEDDVVLDYRHAFYLATLGGARALNLHHRIGTFDINMEFDAIILSAPTTTTTTTTATSTSTAHDNNNISASATNSNSNNKKAATTCYYSRVHVYPHMDTIEDIFQKICVLGDDRNIKRVFVQGRDVTPP